MGADGVNYGGAIELGGAVPSGHTPMMHSGLHLGGQRLAGGSYA